MIKLIDLLKEIRINNPDITPEKVEELIDSLLDNKTLDYEKYHQTFKKLGYVERRLYKTKYGRRSGYSAFIESLPSDKLIQLYIELKKLVDGNL